MKTPTVHSNGTGRATLLREAYTAQQALWAAMDAIRNMTVNGRDYYVQDAGAHAIAIEEHLARVNKLRSLEDEIGQYVNAIEEQK